MRRPGPFIAVLTGALVLTATGCVDGGGDDPNNPNGPGQDDTGRQCTREVVDARTDEVVERWRYGYAIRGHLIWQEVDYGATGDIDFRIDYFYGDNGRVAREEIDDNGAGAPSQILHHFYDASDLLTVTEIESNADGVDARRYFRYDAADRLTLREDDLNADGSIDARTSWTYDDHDNPVRVVLDNGPDGVPNQIISQAWEPIAGQYRMVLREGDWNGDGSWNYRQRLFWSDRGLLVGREIDLNGDGEVDERWEYHYDDRGARISGDGDTTGDGSWDVREVYLQECRAWRNPDR